MSKWILSLASVAMLALAMSGCGGSDGSSNIDGDTNGDGGTTVETPSPSAPANDFTRTPNQFGDTLPEVPMIPELEE